MKYVKTFENFNYEPTNEGLGDWFRGLKDKWNNWRNQKAKEVADKVTKTLEANPKLADAAIAAFNKLPEDVKQTLKAKVESWSPETAVEDKEGAAEVQELVAAEEAIRNTRYGTPLYESYQMAINESTESLGKRVLKALGIGAAAVVTLGLITLIMGALVKILLGMIVAGMATGFIIYVSAVIAFLTFIIGRVGYGVITGK